MPEAIQTAIFKLKDSLQELNEHNVLKKHAINLPFLRGRFGANGYAKQKLVTKNIDGYNLELFHTCAFSEIKWKSFLRTIVADGEKILENKNSIIESYILLVKKKKCKTIYAIAGGFGYLSLQLYCDNEFGLDILSRLIKTDDKVLKAVKERNFTGGILGSIKHFRGDYNLNENESFGNFYQELSAKLNNKILKEKFGFTDSELKKGNTCLAKNSFTIRKSISLIKSIDIIKNIEALLKETPILELNLVKKLSKGDASLIKKLDERLHKNLHTIYKTKFGLGEINVEICHKEFDKYYDSENVICHFTIKSINSRIEEDAVRNFKELIPLYKQQSTNIIDPTSFKKAIDSTYINTFDNSGTVLTQGYLIDHLCTELTLDRKSYFLFNKDWYLMKSDLQTLLNNQCQEFIASSTWTGKLQKWKTTDSENNFNANHIGEPSTLVFDKICPQNIEVCDIMKWTKDEIHFIHVKKGFDNEMRNLCRQVHIAARKVQEDLKSGFSFLKLHYDTLSNMNTVNPYFLNAQKQLKKFTKEDYLKLFVNKKPIFVLAVLDGAVKQRCLNNVLDFESNIAKFCLQGLAQDMRILNIGFEIVQIERA